jgi:hypothetical protein
MVADRASFYALDKPQVPVAFNAKTGAEIEAYENDEDESACLGVVWLCETGKHSD